MFSFFVFREVGTSDREIPTAEVIRRATHDGVFTKDDPVLPEQSTELAKEQAGH